MMGVEDKLSSWKEIANHLNITVRTAQRWEKSEQLPVHRHLHSERHSVYAFRSDLDQWWANRGIRLSQPASERPRRRSWVAFGLLGAVTVAGVGLWMRQPASGQPADSLKAVPLTSYRGHEIFPTLSPDASQVAFSWDGEQGGQYDIYVTKAEDPGVPLRLTTDVLQDFSPAWSPDGKAIAFVRRRPGNKADVLLVLPSVDSAERKLAEIYLPTSGLGGHAGQGRFVAWSPDGKWLAAAAADSPQGTLHLILLSPETGEIRSLTEPSDQFTGDGSPSFSPDGRTLAFTRSTSANLGDIYLLDLLSDLRPRGAPRRLTSLGGYSTSSAWTSDGRGVLFVSGTAAAELRLRKVAVSDGGPVPMEFGDIRIASFALAGGRLVFSQGERGDIDIWAIDLTSPSGPAVLHGGSPVRMVSSSRPDGNPQFSPDGTKIAFGSLRSGNREIYVSNRDGSATVQLTRFAGPAVQHARWSPDGKQLAFLVSSKGSVQIHAIDSAGGAPRLIHSDPSLVTSGPASSLNWSRDGNWIYFVSRRSGTVQSWKAPVVGGTAVQVTRNGGLTARESVDGRFVYYLKGTPPLSLWRIPAGGGDESLVLARVGATVAFGEGGLHFITRAAPSGPATLRFFSFASETVKPIAEIRPQRALSGLAVSPDQRTLIYSESEFGGTDLMLVDGFP